MAECVIRDIWKDELRRSREILEIKKKRLTGLPKGSIQSRSRRNVVYYYLFYRDGDKVKSAYLGNDPEKIERIREQIEQRKSIEQSIRRTKEDIRLLEKAIRLK
ncbi:MAG: hypothetical protein LBG12_14605 [Synergistaceae bacterium]|nr:hypothetical protein [Synergistaceae bacterium]